MLGPKQPRESEMINKEFSKSMFGPHNRYFNENWYSLKIGKKDIERKWLSYSPAKGAVFCHFCTSSETGIKRQLLHKRTQRLKKAQENITKHEKVNVMLKQPYILQTTAARSLERSSYPWKTQSLNQNSN